ncbi:MAG: S9 family peptidase [Candidatus Pacebacteria bacterium]|nr:S9 family peptidase [Candidatus Paceibacterota bacterium]
MNFPKTKKEEISDEMFGINVADSYRWLENADSHYVKEWIEAQNKHTDNALRNEIFEVFTDELVKNFKVTTFSNPVPRRGKYFYSERHPDEDHGVLYMKVGIDGAPVKLVDPNGMNSDNTISLDYWRISRTGKYIAYGLSQGGDEMSTLYIKDTDTNKNLADKILQCRNAQATWLPDDSGFFYCRYPEPGTVPKNEEHLHTKVYFHKLGDDPKRDDLIFGKDRPKDDMLVLSLSLDGRYLAISAAQKWTENDIYIYNHETKKTMPFVVGVHAQFSGFFLKDRVIIRTNYKANNYRVLSMPIESMFTPIDEWKEIIPESEYLLESLSPTRDRILAEYLANTCAKVEIFDHDGQHHGEIPLPPYSTLSGISTNREEDEFFYGVTSFTVPKIIYRYIPEENKFVEYRKMDNPINPDDYAVKQEWYTSKDSTRVPMFIFHRKDIAPNTAHATILYGYGGFGHIESPSFKRGFVPWLEHGGIFAVVNIRGGGEFGDDWHKGGIKENKQNSFDDFISAGEFLIKQRYTDSKHLGILGGSNGGLLVSAVAIQRSDLFKAVCSRVPLTDMVRFPMFGMAMRWIHEYGNPKNEEDLKNIVKWSPYHNVKDEKEYPAFLFTTAEKDSRVDPLHSRKMTAMLQSVNKENDVLLFTEKEAGHGSGKPIKKIVEPQALILTFFANKLGLQI